jgi:hypothetical protein
MVRYLRLRVALWRIDVALFVAKRAQAVGKWAERAAGAAEASVGDL